MFTSNVKLRAMSTSLRKKPNAPLANARSTTSSSSSHVACESAGAAGCWLMIRSVRPQASWATACSPEQRHAGSAFIRECTDGINEGSVSSGCCCNRSAIKGIETLCTPHANRAIAYQDIAYYQYSETLANSTLDNSKTCLAQTKFHGLCLDNNLLGISQTFSHNSNW